MSLPVRVVEPAIALSIACVAIENVLTGRVRASRIALVFTFGLAHGMGFAGVLKELGLPRRDFLPYRPRVVVPLSLGIAAVGLYWTGQRLLG